VRVSGGYGEGRGEQLIQNEILNYRSENYSAGTGINMNPFSFFGLNYSLNWWRNKTYTVERPERFPAIRGISQNAQFSVFITKMITVNISAEHQYNSAVYDGNRNTSFADAGIKFRHKQLDLELEVNNIFNSKRYVSASYSDISTYYYSYSLRPASVLLRARFKLK
jgi:outer membrane receptor protein involved in Fe transport